MSWDFVICRRIGLMLALVLFALASAGVSTSPRASEAEAWAALAGDRAIVLFRHAEAPGTGDPAGFRLGACATQRNLDARGREQARRIGAVFRERGIRVGRVLTSQWCRTRETADLAFPGQAVEAPAFNSFFGDRSTEPAQTEAARATLLDWSGPGALIVSTHQVNITALTGIVPASGEGIVLRREGDRLVTVGRIKP